ncbi:MAG TPA: sigma-70 family RNA polymerase sigma factor [Phycisphaerae bacterium]|nr:sigma-70 family RNA polymerase sigma factor [Phycisphaerae bacterium]
MYAQVSTHVTLLNRLVDGSDLSAWTDFHRRYGELIRGFARRRGAQDADCDDVLQDVLVSLTRAMPQFSYDPQRGKFRSFLKTVVDRAVYKKLRQNPPDSSLDAFDGYDAIGEGDGDADAAWESEWRHYHIRQAMQTIDVEFNQSDRLVFRHYVVGGKAPGETAELLGVTINQVYKAKSNILKRLSELIARQVEEEG